MTKDEILARINEKRSALFGGGIEESHLMFDQIVTDVLTYIAEGGEDPAEVAQQMLLHDSPTEWGWYA